MMDGNQIYQILHQDSNFAGVLSADQITEKKIGLHKYYIVNTSATYPGNHWIVMGRNNFNHIYFDSAGQTPYFYQEYFNHFLNSNGPYVINTVRVQQINSTSCALFCIFFIRMMGLKKSYREIMNMFSHDLSENEKLIKNYINGMITPKLSL